MSNKLFTCLWFDKGEARKAAGFYASIFPDSHVVAVNKAASDSPGGQQGEELTVEFTVLTPRRLTDLVNAGGERARRAFEAMMTMKKIDVAALEAAANGESVRA